MNTKAKKITIRSIESQYSVRKADDGKTYVDFYASVFNQQSNLIREWGEVFYEVIAPTAFDNVLTRANLNTIATIDHEREKMIARVKSGTLTMVTDKTGLKCSVEMPDTTLGRDMLVMIDRGDYFECSFIYTIDEGGVTYDRTPEIPVRTITNVANLYDVSMVIDGAYSNTNIKKRQQEWEIDTDDEPAEATTTTEAENSATPPSDILQRYQKQIDILKLIK